MRHIGHTLIGALLVVLGVGVHPASAETGPSILRVPAGDVQALYAAVYENGEPRAGATIILEGTDTFSLDPTDGPFNGRLVLGEGTTLRSQLALEVDHRGVPTGRTQVPGAVIDTAQLQLTPPATRSFEEANAVVLTRGAALRNLTLRNSDPTDAALGGIDILEAGTVTQVIIESHPFGLQVRVDDGDADISTGRLSRSILRDNGSAIVPAPANVTVGAPSGQEVSHAQIRLTAQRNLVTDNGGGLLSPGGLDGTTGNTVRLVSVDNTYANSAVGVVARAATAGSPATSDNTLHLVSRGDEFSGTQFVGLSVSGIGRSPTQDEPVGTGNNNRGAAVVTDATFSGNSANDVESFGSESPFAGEAIGSNNRSTVRLGSTVPGAAHLARSEIDCVVFGADNSQIPVEPCANRAKILPPLP